MDEMTAQEVEELKEQMREVLKNQDANSLAHTMAAIILNLETPS